MKQVIHSIIFIIADSKERTEAFQPYIQIWNETVLNLVFDIIVRCKQRVLKVNWQREFQFLKKDLGAWELIGLIQQPIQLL